MPSFSGKAPGKIILFGEHAVVYDQPAIAIPVSEVNANAVVSAAPLRPEGEVWIEAPDIHLNQVLADLPVDHAFQTLFGALTKRMKAPRLPAMHITIHSTIPIAAGMGSGAAISVAVIRAVCAFMNFQISDTELNEIAFQVEKSYHGTPSGIDNTVVTFEKPIFFTRGAPFEPLDIGSELCFIIGDSGAPSRTIDVVSDVRRRWSAQPEIYELYFQSIGILTRKAREQMKVGNSLKLGGLMNENHALLQKINVSSPELDFLVDAALGAGALGAKLSGAGWGGNMIALINRRDAEKICSALTRSGANRTIITELKPSYGGMIE
ncbi:MAG: mevalonate kinase [Anaerolineae bacterium]|nr:mevalonate kinase [Anaerolineae bacterium]